MYKFIIRIIIFIYLFIKNFLKRYKMSSKTSPSGSLPECRPRRACARAQAGTGAMQSGGTTSIIFKGPKWSTCIYLSKEILLLVYLTNSVAAAPPGERLRGDFSKLSFIAQTNNATRVFNLRENRKEINKGRSTSKDKKYWTSFFAITI